MQRITHVSAWHITFGFLGVALLLTLAIGRADDQPGTVLKIEHFDKDPGWEGFNNRIVVRRVPIVTQDFGYSPSNFAGKEKGEIGGRIQRSGRLAYYADTLRPPRGTAGSSSAGSTPSSPGAAGGR